jgi:hypothetical protein
MLKSSVLTLCLLGCGVVAAQVVIADDAKPAAPQAKPVASSSGCTRDTGTRLRRNTDGCPGIGSSYSKDQLFRTGASNPSGALRMLDPSVTITR